MTVKLSEYVERQQSITESIVSIVLALVEPFLRPEMGTDQWLGLLELAYPYVENHRYESAELAREFYDSERSEHYPQAGIHETFLAGYKPEWFVRDMGSIRGTISREDAGEQDASRFAGHVAAIVEDGGRETLIHAADTDPLDVAWARVATGRETCGFCLMLVSRGPVYTSAENAGINTDDLQALELYGRSQSGDQDAHKELNALMRKFHDFCDCKVVPVFDRNNWPGMQAQQEALELWKSLSEGRNGKETLSRLRQAVYYDEVDFSSVSAV